MGVLLKIIISRDSDGVHVNQARFNGKWYHISIRGFNCLGTTTNFGSIINLEVKPFHLSSSMNRPAFTKVSIFIEEIPMTGPLCVSRRASAGTTSRPANSLSSIQTMLILLWVFWRTLTSAPTNPPLAPLSIE